MIPIPMELPLKTSEAAALADIIFQHTEGRDLTDDLRSRLASRVAALGLETVRPFVGSLAKDPTHAAAFYLPVDALAGGAPKPLLLHVALSASPATSLFPQPLLIGRMRPGGGREVVVNAIPFDSRDWTHIRTFAEKLDSAFLPRPQGSQAAIAVGNRHPEISLPAAFEAFRAILRTHRVNLASTTQLSGTREMTTDDAIAARDGENPTAAGHTRVSIRHLYHAGLWAAIRAGWREGFTAEADHIIITGNTEDDIARSIEAGKLAIEHAAGYTKFTTDTSRLFELAADPRHPRAWSDAAVEDRFRAVFSGEEQRWLLAEFSRPLETASGAYSLTRQEILRLAVKFGRAFKVNEDLYDHIRRMKAARGGSRAFDFEPSIDEADTLTTAPELIFCMHWLRARGRPAQLVPPNLGFKKRQAYPDTFEALEAYSHHKMWPELLPRVQREFAGKPLEELRARVAELAAVARHFNGTLSIHSGSGKQAEVLDEIGRATQGRVNYKISGELQLQLFDVLSEQDAGSPWRQLYERMAARCNDFAARGAFGEESELAEKYLRMGRGIYLGDSARGRVDGNLFLVFWIGNLVGSRDTAAPDGDARFFKEKLDELPPALVQQVQQRNTNYIVWLAEHLRG